MGKKKEFKDMVSADPALLTRAVDAGGNTLLHVAAANGKIKILKEILRQLKAHPAAIDLAARNRRGKTALDCALDFNFTEIAEYLRKLYPELAGAPSSAPAGEDAAVESGSGEEGSSSPPQQAPGNPPGPESATGADDAAAVVEMETETAAAEAPAPVGDEEAAADAPAAEPAASEAAEAAEASEVAEAAEAAVSAEEAAPSAETPPGMAAPVEQAGEEQQPAEGSGKAEAAEGGVWAGEEEGGSVDEEIQQVERELEATRNKAKSLEEEAAAQVPPESEQSATVELDESVAQLASSASAQLAAPEGGSGESTGGAAEAAVELDEPVEELSFSPSKPAQRGGEEAAGGDAAAAADDGEVAELPVTPKRDESGGGGATQEAGEDAIEEQVAVESPEPPPVDLTADGSAL